MLEVFDENKYNFTDSILDVIKIDDQKLDDYLIVLDYFLGKDGGMPITLRLKNVKKLSVSINKEFETYLISLLTLAHISKKEKGKFVELEIFSAMTFSSEHQNDEPLIYCLCEEVYIEK